MRIETIRTTRWHWVEVARAITPPALWQALYRRLVVRDIPDADQYRPHHAPWAAPWFRALHAEVAPHTLVSIDRCWMLWASLSQALHVPGDAMEAGVFQGGTARLLARAMQDAGDRRLHLFDSFDGMERVREGADRHQAGDFADTSLDAVRRVVGAQPFVRFHKGWIPDSFAGLEDARFCFAHIDLDLHDGVRDTLEYLYPRLSPGGIIVFDDYGFASCPGARRAVDGFFADKREVPLALPTAQAVVHKL